MHRDHTLQRELLFTVPLDIRKCHLGFKSHQIGSLFSSLKARKTLFTVPLDIRKYHLGFISHQIGSLFSSLKARKALCNIATTFSVQMSTGKTDLYGMKVCPML